jgi:phage FluMu protein Com
MGERPRIIDLRCPNVLCGGFLAREFDGTHIEIVCHKCKLKVSIRRELPAPAMAPLEVYSLGPKAKDGLFEKGMLTSKLSN